MLPRPRRPREKRVVAATRAAYSIPEFCAMTGLSRAAVLRSIDDGSLRAIKVGNRRLILACATIVHA
jgi:excisionase family DNA binding protein